MRGLNKDIGRQAGEVKERFAVWAVLFDNDASGRGAKPLLAGVRQAFPAGD